ncbi:phosphonate C-P lyase system protein PhnG [Acetomicrobium sp. S15 = DSM 107314]|uniref:phosphonate C-P lyase system protein PhnG n=1 Tax=Acetomicrobium sp. S15 = DSM 107314 TaxID=2529858 RepID=UPI0018E1805B|nr:phosphonate C-P lyase system protein PhnG [Acetomicrobium sp. S15 = DSM 107314]
MEREKLFDILSMASDETIEDVAKLVLEEAPDVETIKGPRVGLVMMQAKESVEDEIFNLGEVLVSECAVTSGNFIGWGICMGENLKKASNLALIDLAFEASLPVASKIVAVAEKEQKDQEAKKEELFAAVLRSRVDFEVI